MHGHATEGSSSCLNRTNLTCSKVFSVHSFLDCNFNKWKPAAMKKTITHVRAIALGLASILAITPAISVPITPYLPLDGFNELRLGLAVFFSTPSSISTCVVLSQQVRRDNAPSYFATNLLFGWEFKFLSCPSSVLLHASSSSPRQSSWTSHEPGTRE